MAETKAKKSQPAEVTVKANQNVTIGGVSLAQGETGAVPASAELYECVNAGLVDYA